MAINFSEQVLRSKTADEARRLLREQGESIGLVVALGFTRALAGYDPHVVLTALERMSAKAVARRVGFSRDALVKVRQSTDLVHVSMRDLLGLMESSPPSAPPSNVDDIGRTMLALRCAEMVVGGVLGGYVKPRSRSIGDVVADEYEQFALAFFRALRTAREERERRGEPVAARETRPAPEHEAATERWFAAKERRSALAARR